MAGVDYDIPPGYTFLPNDFDAVYHYLMNKAYGRALPFNAIPEFDFYSFNPDEIPNDDFVLKVGRPVCCFAYDHQKHQNNTKHTRWTSKGYWKAIGADTDIKHNGEVIGYRKNLVFHWDKSADGKQANFIMSEYRLNPLLNADDPNIRRNIENLLFCKVEMRAPDVIYVPLVRLLEEDSESSDEEEMPSAEDEVMK